MIPFSAVPGSKLLQYLDSGERLLMPKKVAAEGDMSGNCDVILDYIACLARAVLTPPPVHVPYYMLYLLYLAPMLIGC